MKHITSGPSISCSTMTRLGERERTRASEPLLELVLNLLKRGAIGCQAPVCRLAIPNHECEAEHFRDDSPHSVVGVSIRRSLVSRKTSPSRVVNDLQYPTNLSNELSVGESYHARTSPGVYTVALLECAKENLRTFTDVGANHKVADLLILLFEEAVESRASIGISNGTVVQSCHWACLRFRLCLCTDRYRSIFLVHWDLDRRRLGCQTLGMVQTKRRLWRISSHC